MKKQHVTISSNVSGATSRSNSSPSLRCMNGCPHHWLPGVPPPSTWFHFPDNQNRRSLESMHARDQVRLLVHLYCFRGTRRVWRAASAWTSNDCPWVRHKLHSWIWANPRCPGLGWARCGSGSSLRCSLRKPLDTLIGSVSLKHNGKHHHDHESIGRKPLMRFLLNNATSFSTWWHEGHTNFSWTAIEASSCCAIIWRVFEIHSCFYCSQCSTRCQNDCKKDLNISHGMKWMHMLQEQLRGTPQVAECELCHAPTKMMDVDPSNAKSHAKTCRSDNICILCSSYVSTHRFQSKKSTQVLNKEM